MGVKLDDIAKAARDGFTTSVGLGVLLYQRAQVHRQAIRRTVEKVAAELGGRRHNPARPPTHRPVVESTSGRHHNHQNLD